MFNRESRLWSFPLFHLYEDDYDGIMLWSVICGIFSGFIFAFIGSETMFMIPVLVKVIGFLSLWVFFVFIVPQLGRISILSNIDDSGHRSLRDCAKQYLRLSEKDRLIYPPNLLEILSDPDLTYDQQSALRSSMISIYAEIEERNQLEEKLIARHIDIAPVIDDIRMSTSALAEDNRMYREKLRG